MKQRLTSYGVTQITNVSLTSVWLLLKHVLHMCINGTTRRNGMSSAIRLNSPTYFTGQAAVERLFQHVAGTLLCRPAYVLETSLAFRVSSKENHAYPE